MSPLSSARWFRSSAGWKKSTPRCARSPGFFIGKPVVLDLSAVDLSQNAIAHLISSLEQRDIRVLGIEGVDAGQSHGEHAAFADRRTRIAGLSQKNRRRSRPSRSRRRCCSKTRCAPASRSSSPKATSRSWARSAPARKSSPAARSTSTERCAAGRWPASTATRPRESTARKSRPSCWRSTATTEPQKKSTPALRSRPAQVWLEGDIMKITPLN